jgi:hypothetical protein
MTPFCYIFPFGRNLFPKILLRSIPFLALFVSVPFLTQGQEPVSWERWSENTAFLMPAGKWESGIFQPFRLGLSGRVELRSNALLMPMLPNVGIKAALGEGNQVSWASEHSVSYPTLFLNLVSMKGTGGLISPQFDFPFMISLSNSLLASFRAGSSTLVTAHAGIAITFRSSKPDYQSSIDIPFIYQRMAHFYDGASLRTGISVKKALVRKLFWEEAFRFFLITRSHDNLFLENAGTLMWTSHRSFRIKAGYIVSWGNYPFGIHLQMWPSVDILFGSKVSRQK